MSLQGLYKSSPATTQAQELNRQKKTLATGEAQERTPDKLPNYRNFNHAGPFANEDCEWPISFMISLTEL